MYAYSVSYLDEVVENQGRLFDYVAYTYPDKSTEDFILNYMKSKTRKYMDEGQAYVLTMDYLDLLEYYHKHENVVIKDGQALQGFIPDWIGEFYAYYQWYYNIDSAEVVDKIPVSYLIKAYPGLHDLQLELAVKKVGLL